MHVRTTVLVLVAAMWLAGCDDEGADVRIDEFMDEGALCLSSRGAGSERVLRVRAIFPTCLSSSCSKARATRCQVTRDGDVLRVESSGVAQHRGGDCTADCGTLAATCDSEPLPAGEYTLQYGDRTETITLPLADASGLFGDAPVPCNALRGDGGDGGSGGAGGQSGGGAGGGDEDGGRAGDGDAGRERCENGEIVDSAAECLQDDAFCEPLGDGRYCTGPAAPMCPEGWMPIAPNADCPDRSQCITYSESLTCTRPLDPVRRCAPHDARFTGACEPADLYYWNGIACVGRHGCECHGAHCEAGFASLEACTEAFEGCEEDVVRCGARAGDTCADDEYCAYVPGLACGAADAPSICQPRPTACDDVHDPVCGCDDVTYPNACEANAAGVGVADYGECP